MVESPVALLLSEAGSRRNAMTLSFFSEVAHHPTTLWVSVGQGCYTHQLMQESGRFSLALLRRGQRDLALRCGTVSGRQADKCAALALYRSADGFLYLAGALACVSCRIRSLHPAGDHTLFVADLLSGEFDTRSALYPHLLTTDLV